MKFAFKVSSNFIISKKIVTFIFQFNNLLGAVYRRGDLVFTPDGNSLIGAVGNKISIYDLKKY